MSATEQKQASVGLHKYLSILVNAVLWVAVAASFFLFFGIATNVFFDLGPAGFHNLVAKTAKPLIHNERIAAALLLFLILTAIRRFLAHRRQVPPRSAFWLVVPLMLTTVWFPTGQMFPFMFVLTILVFVWSELIRQWPLPPDGDTTFPRSGWIQIGIGLAMAVWIVATAAASDSAAVAVGQLLSCAMLWAVLNFRRRAFLRAQAFLLLIVVPATTLAAVAWPKTTTPSVVPALTVALLGFVAFHLVMLRVEAKKLRWANTAMLVMLAVGLAMLEVLLTPLQLDTRAKPGQERAETKNKLMPQRGGRLLATLQHGQFNDLPLGWGVEVGRIRGPQPAKKRPAGTYRIIVEGSSSTEGCGVPRDEDVWSFVLERKLNDLGLPYRVEVINAGVAGTTTFDMLLNFKLEMVNYEPNMLILYIGHNDQSYSFGPLTEREMFEAAMRNRPADRKLAKIATAPASATAPRSVSPAWHWAVALQNVLSRSSLYRVFRRGLLEMRDTPGMDRAFGRPLAPAVMPTEFIDNLLNLARFCRERGVQLVLVGEAARVNLSRYQTMMAEIAGQENVPFVNANFLLRSCTNDVPSLFTDNVHLTVPGNACIAEIVKNMLVQNRLLPARAP